MFVKRRKNLNFNNNDEFVNLNYDKVPAQNQNNNNNNGGGEVINSNLDNIQLRAEE